MDDPTPVPVAPTSPQCRQSVLNYERRFRDFTTGDIDILALFDSLRDQPAQMALYLQASREMRAERKRT